MRITDNSGPPSSNSAAPSNAAVPAGAVNTSDRLRHTITWTDSAAPDNRRKRRSTMGAEIWLKLAAAPPTDEKDCSFLSLNAATPYPSEIGNSRTCPTDFDISLFSR